MKRLIFKIKRANESLKRWLSNNKIYFETLVMLTLTLTGILVSCVAISISNTANELSDKSNDINMANLELYKNEMLPMLSHIESTYDEFKNKQYYVINTGDGFYNYEYRSYNVLTILVAGSEWDEKGVYSKKIYIEFALPSYMDLGGYDAKEKRFDLFFYNREEIYTICNEVSDSIRNEIKRRELTFSVFPGKINGYIFMDYNDKYLKERHSDGYVVPDMTFIDMGNPLELSTIGVEEEERIKELLRIDITDDGTDEIIVSDNLIDIAMKQFEEQYRTVEKVYFPSDIW